MEATINLYNMDEAEAWKLRDNFETIELSAKANIEFLKYMNYSKAKMRSLPQTGRISIKYRFHNEISKELSKKITGFAFRYGFNLIEIENDNMVTITDTWDHAVEETLGLMEDIKKFSKVADEIVII